VRPRCDEHAPGLDRSRVLLHYQQLCKERPVRLKVANSFVVEMTHNTQAYLGKPPVRSHGERRTR
jgi:hypothetical protein